MSCKGIIITVINTIGPTSMPFNEFVLYRANHFPDEEHCVVVLGPVNGDFIKDHEKQWEKMKVKVICCAASYLGLRRAVKEVLGIYKKQRAMVVIHLHQPRSGLAVQLLDLCYLRRTPVLFTVHNMFTGYPFHNKVLSALNFLLADHITVVSHSAYNVYPKLLRRIKGCNAYVLPNGVDVQRIDKMIATRRQSVQQASQTEDSNTFRLLNVGRLNEQKHQDWLVQLLPELPENVNLTIVGVGPHEDALKNLAGKLRVEDRVRFTGLIPRGAVYEEMLKADVFVSSSRWEGLPVASIEAMALKRPVVLSDIAPHREIGRCGSSVEIISADISKWVASIKSLISMTREQRDHIGCENRELVEKHFSLERMHERYTQLYEELWSQSKGG